MLSSYWGVPFTHAGHYRLKVCNKGGSRRTSFQMTWRMSPNPNCTRCGDTFWVCELHDQGPSVMSRVLWEQPPSERT
jgi:hypothetical protein